MKRSIKRFKSVVFIVRQTRVLAYLLFATSSKCRYVLYFRLALLEGFKVWINLLAESSFPARKNSRNTFNWLVSAAIFAANEKHMVLKCACDPSFRRSRWNSMARCERSIDVSKYIQFFRLSYNIQTLFYWERKGELYTSYHIQLIS